MPSSITLDHVHFQWPDGDIVIDDLSASFSQGRTSLIGDNGTGKSTLLRLIAGELIPTSGTIICSGDVSYLPQTIHTDHGTLADLLGVRTKLDALSAIENGSIDPHDFDVVGDDWDIETKAELLLADLGLPQVTGKDLNRDVRTLSGGEAMAIAVAGVRLAHTAITLLDEPSNNMDASSRAALMAMIDSWPGTLIVVSHDIDLLERMDSTAELRRGSLTIVGGPYSAWKEAMEIETAAAIQAEKTAEQEVRTAKRQKAATMERTTRNLARGKDKAIKEGMGKGSRDFMRGVAEAGAGRARGVADERIGKAQEALEEASSRLRSDEHIRVDLPDPDVPQGKRILELAWGDREPFIMAGPERVALTGPNGVGKTTLIEQMLGMRPPSDNPIHGELMTDRVGYLPQMQVPGDETLTPLEAVERVAPNLTQGEVRNRLARMLIRGDTVFRPIASLSGGERFRISLARLLFTEPPAQLLILDEPTNNLDLTSISQLVEALSDYKGALLVVSHNPQFLEDLGVDVTVELTRDGMSVART